jgi:hypothetical protein
MTHVWVVAREDNLDRKKAWNCIEGVYDNEQSAEINAEDAGFGAQARIRELPIESSYESRTGEPYRSQQDDETLSEWRDRVRAIEERGL